MDDVIITLTVSRVDFWMLYIEVWQHYQRLRDEGKDDANLKQLLFYLQECYEREEEAKNCWNCEYFDIRGLACHPTPCL